ncbi:YqhR family membrane protein [Gordoniibacillus kamchatkensis]|uniref:YqhR family membrane protein n=1 Tax=Gordoniibacillus kamchatkensis TaxID=1590651 RepID=UPI00069694D1|nr:YqhR family membrane protein [Paenibacillus sp. VKM B-2647]
MVEYFFKHDFLTTVWGGVVGWMFFTLFSAAAGILYAAILRKVKGPWPGLLYGVLWWVFLYLLFGPVAGMLPPVQKLGWTTLITDLCLFVLWGLFIGYSIAVEFTKEEKRDQDPDGLLGKVLK